MFWNFYDNMGECHWTEVAHEDDTPQTMRRWWDRFMHEEEYSPEISEIVLEDFNGTWGDAWASVSVPGNL